jgi:uncharacterized protein YgiM (DUF1202 family)
MKKKICIVLVVLLCTGGLTGCSAWDVVKDILSVNSADTSDNGPKVSIAKPTPTPAATATPAPTATATPTPTEKPREMVYCISPVNVRESSNNQSAIIGALTQGQEVEKLGEENSWVKIDYNGKTGWVYNKYVSSEKTGE